MNIPAKDPTTQPSHITAAQKEAQNLRVAPFHRHLDLSFLQGESFLGLGSKGKAKGTPILESPKKDTPTCSKVVPFAVFTFTSARCSTTRRSKERSARLKEPRAFLLAEPLSEGDPTIDGSPEKNNTQTTSNNPVRLPSRAWDPVVKNS